MIRNLPLSSQAILVCAALAVSCAAQTPSAPAKKPDPSQAQVPLPAQGGFEGELIYENDVGIWTCGTVKAFPQYGCPEAFGLDDKGRCILFMSYSGKWTPYQTVEDREWLGALAQLDLDPEVPGPEIYTGGKVGNLYQIVPHREGGFDTRIIARFPSQEIHTFVAGDLLPEQEGNELIVFTLRGETYEVRQHLQANGLGLETRQIAVLEGRVRQALLLPARAGEAPWFVCSCRTGEILLLRRTKDGFDQQVVTKEPMGFGRIALRPGAEVGAPVVVYAGRDDGLLLRLEGRPGDKEWKREVVYAGPQGIRGVAAGHFDADHSVETVAVYGYSMKVQLLSRSAGEPWRAETIFTDIDKGHWLSAVELDGRNNTDELMGSGYGKRLFLLRRPAGYGLESVPSDPDPPPAPAPSRQETGMASPENALIRPLRVAVAAAPDALATLSPLSYRGGFEAKTCVYETLVRLDDRGNVVPALAKSFDVAADGRSVRFTLRDGARFHDGSAVDAESVRLHFRRWVGLPEHGWIGANQRIANVVVESADTLRVDLDRPYPLLFDLCAVNPCAIRAPGSLDREGNFVRPVGSGRFEADGVLEDGKTLRLHCVDAGVPDALDLVAFPRTQLRHVMPALLDGRVDAAIDGSAELVPRDLPGPFMDPSRFTLSSSPGSSVVYVSFRGGDAPTADVALRRRLAAAVDRAALVRDVERGHADPCGTFAPPSIAWWPRAAEHESTSQPAAPALEQALRFIVRVDAAREAELAAALAVAWNGAGFRVAIAHLDAEHYAAAIDRGEYDVRIERTWGVPYDPVLSLANRFLPQPATATAAERRARDVDPRLAALVADALATTDPAALAARVVPIQEFIEREVAVLPLYVPHRLAIVRAGAPAPRMDHDLYRFSF